MEAREEQCAAKGRGVGQRALAAEARSGHAELSRCSVLARSPREKLEKSTLKGGVRTREILCVSQGSPSTTAGSSCLIGIREEGAPHVHVHAP